MTSAARAAAEVRDPAGRTSGAVRGIAFEGVSFSYGGPDRTPAVEDATLAIPAGALAVIAGPSGSGKTTLADLAAGVLVPDRGRVLVDGESGASVGYAAQDGLLLHGTVRSNLLRARPGATEEEIRAALALSGGGDPDRETGERGQALSAGERRRVLLARALVRDPSLLVLDGVADGLDPAEEGAVLDALEGLRGRATVLLVSHGEEAARRADLVVRMEKGRIAPVARKDAP
jgi:ABC-type multidrug transport system fused ATPase/permease subunit